MSELVESEKRHSDKIMSHKKLCREGHELQEEELKMNKPSKNIFALNFAEVEDSESKASLMHVQYYHAD
jgi:hypothetical protein